MCAWVRMTGETTVVGDGKGAVDGPPILSELPDGFARHHGDGQRDVYAARGALHGDGQPRIRRLMDKIRHACGFAEVVTQAVAPNGSDVEIERAASRMAEAAVDLVVYDCMGYGHELRARADSITKAPSILSVSLVARVVAELIDATPTGDRTPIV